MDGSHTAYVSKAKEALVEQEEDIDLKTALAALELDTAGLQRITAVAGRAAGEL